MSTQDGPLAIGEVVDGRYRVEAVLGTGGLGVVYRAAHLGLDRAVALKVLHAAYGLEEDIQKRFGREARALSSLAHPRIVAVSDFGVADGVSYLAMELLLGHTLADRIHEGPLDPELAVDVMLQILEGLAFAHARGVIHRDLKPSNVFLVEGPAGGVDVRILDFGLAKIGDPDAEEPPSPTLTQLGTVLGTPSYMSPEQAATRAADARSDVYSAGIVLYEMLAGRPPFDCESRVDTIRAHLVEDVPPPSRFRPGLELRPELSQVLGRSLAKLKEARPANAGEMLEALRAVARPVARAAEEGRHQARAPAASGEEPTVLAGVPSPVAAPSAVALRGRPARRRWRGWLAVLGLAVAALGVGLASSLLSAAGPEPSAGDADPGRGDPGLTVPSIAASPRDEPPPDEAAAVARVPARDPLAGALPRALRAPARTVKRGRPLTRAQIRTLRAHQQAHGGDPRPSLLLGHDHAGRGWLGASLERYRLAHSIDPSSRGTPWMLSDLVDMAQTEAHGREAGTLLLDVYAGEALEPLEAALARTRDPATRRRLERLRERLGSP